MPLLLPFLECKGVSKDLKDNGYKNTLQKSAIVQMDGACVTPATGPVVLNREVALECCGLEYATEEGVVGAPRHKPFLPPIQWGLSVAGHGCSGFLIQKRDLDKGCPFIE